MEYFVNNSVVVDFLIWVNRIKILDEIYFVILIYNFNFGILGSFKGKRN